MLLPYMARANDAQVLVFAHDIEDAKDAMNESNEAKSFLEVKNAHEVTFDRIPTSKWLEKFMNTEARTRYVVVGV